ncbi:cation:proton antiporter [Prosthecodimorpha staleyi]|uniref:Monovalent cation/H(+) antiporter subunit G n=1 Tax=Prosthecodimorpha staleyi TaxID=2840188 RepID=A0A947GBD1_9HYPH|nr:monovalent cation/H(+) antiporter subunit G [Prosthecodimorpha staleyi]MBT9288542.1 monovalent cation/H(+) antiporter subunit G [Prosthecodimorpha staleyi]
MTLVAEAFAAALILVGGAFLLLGSTALARLRDPLRRLHAPTLAATVGLGAILIASMLDSGLVRADPSWHELAIALFLFLTAPVSAQMIAKVHLLEIDPATLPAPREGGAWASQAPEDGVEDRGGPEARG